MPQARRRSTRTRQCGGSDMGPWHSTRRTNRRPTRRSADEAAPRPARRASKRRTFQGVVVSLISARLRRRRADGRPPCDPLWVRREGCPGLGRQVEGGGRGRSAGKQQQLDQALRRHRRGLRIEIPRTKIRRCRSASEHVHFFCRKTKCSKSQAGMDALGAVARHTQTRHRATVSGR